MSPVTGTALWVLALLIAWLWRPRQAPGPSAWILLIAFGALGAWALWFGLYAHPGEPAGFAFWKPTVLYWTLAAIMIIAPLLGWGYPVKIIFGSYFALSNREWRWTNLGCATVYTILGGVNLLVASEASYNEWVGFKFSCMMNPALHRPVPPELRLATHPRGCVHLRVSARHCGPPVSVELVLNDCSNGRCEGARIAQEILLKRLLAFPCILCKKSGVRQ